ncbi:hypothetical protein [Pedobacter sp. MW01-1-1]|uniref:hypothetical protein n=1 Tax=Pedobacter sp. MW01-1-1 TaxID=3383027 RepID=UPI003FEF92A0
MKKIVMFLLCFSIGKVIMAQEVKHDSVTVQPPLVLKINQATSWLAKQGFQIRRTFDGSKNESKAAAISLNSDYENKKYFTVIDAGIKLADFELLPNSSVIWSIFPKVEWHKNTINDDSKKKNNFSAGLGTELLLNKGEKWFSRPILTSSFDYKKDYVKDLKTTQTTAFLSFSGKNAGEPGAMIRGKNGSPILRYYPYTGIEYYHKMEGGKQNASMWASRLWFELYPLSSKEYQYIQLTFDFTYRKVFNDDLYQTGNMRWLILGFNFFPSGKTNLGLGLDYSYGEDPTSNFVKTDLLALGIKLKI